MSKWGFGTLGYAGVWHIPGANAGQVPSVTHTPGTTAYGTPTQIVASAPFDVGFIHLRCGTSVGASNARRDALLKVQIGSAGNEQNIIGPVLIGGRLSNFGIALPISIPAGTRISLTVKGNGLSGTQVWHAILYKAHPLGVYPQQWVAYGVNDTSTTHHGVLVAAGATNTWGSWTAVTTSTDYEHELWMPMASSGTASTTSGRVYRFQFVGATTASAPTSSPGTDSVWDDLLMGTTTSEICYNSRWASTAVGGLVHPTWPFNQKLAAGSALSVRAYCSGTVDANAISAAVLGAIF